MKRWTLLTCLLAIGCSGAESISDNKYDAGSEVDNEADADVEDAADDVPFLSDQKDAG